MYRLYSKVCLDAFHLKLWRCFYKEIKFQVYKCLFTYIYLKYESLWQLLLSLPTLTSTSFFFFLKSYGIDTFYQFLNPWKLCVSELGQVRTQKLSQKRVNDLKTKNIHQNDVQEVKELRWGSRLTIHIFPFQQYSFGPYIVFMSPVFENVFIFFLIVGNERNHFCN